VLVLPKQKQMLWEVLLCPLLLGLPQRALPAALLLLPLCWHLLVLTGWRWG
jgi:hypothetical protein